MSDIRLNDWITSEKAHLDEFFKWWINSQAIHPEDYPMSMPPGKWDEQYRGWCGG